jgi:hypothetical protein
MTTDDILIILVFCAACIAWALLATLPIHWLY